MHQELRVRTICELTCHEQYYLQPTIVSVFDASGCISSKNVLPATSANFGRAYDESPDHVVITCFHIDCLETTKSSTFSSMWHVHALSTVIESTILSVYPQCNSHIRALLNKVVQPRAGNPANRSITIMWTRTGPMTRQGWWSPNHFVLCVPTILQSQHQAFSTQACSPKTSSSHSSHSNPKAHSSHSNPKAYSSHSNPKAHSSHSNPKAHSSHSNPKAHSSHNTKKVLLPQVSPKVPLPQVSPKAPSPQVSPKAPSPQVSPKAPLPQVSPKAPSPQVSPKAPSPQVSPKAPSPQVSPKAPSPQVSPKAPSPQVSPKAPLPQVSPKAPSPQEKNDRMLVLYIEMKWGTCYVSIAVKLMDHWN